MIDWLLDDIELEPKKFDKMSFREITDEESAKSWGNEHYGKWAKEYRYAMDSLHDSLGLSVDMIEQYGGSVAREVNSFLRGYSSVSFNRRWKDIDLKEMSRVLMTIIALAPTIPENIVLYRSVPDSFIYSLYDNARDKINTVEKGFLSTSVLKKIVNIKHLGYAEYEYLLKLYVNKGTYGIFAEQVEKCYVEYEMLLLPNGIINVIEKPYMDRSIGKKIVECKIYYPNQKWCVRSY